jgi:tetratricopeptide (TPR) repeat protein
MRLKFSFALALIAGLNFVAYPAYPELIYPFVISSERKVGQLDQKHLFELLASAPSEARGREIENEIWRNWMVAPNEEIQNLLKQALEARRWYDFEKARIILDQIIEQSPEYAEGWNQRAFILFLQEKFDRALSDTEKALELEPRHFGAMAGQAQILMRQGRFATGQSILKKAVKIHPYLRERSMIIKTQEQDL